MDEHNEINIDVIDIDGVGESESGE